MGKDCIVEELAICCFHDYSGLNIGLNLDNCCGHCCTPDDDSDILDVVYHTLGCNHNEAEAVYNLAACSDILLCEGTIDCASIRILVFLCCTLVDNHSGSNRLGHTDDVEGSELGARKDGALSDMAIDNAAGGPPPVGSLKRCFRLVP